MSGASRPFAAVRFARPTDDRDAIASIENRMRERGHEPVEPENPYWNDDLSFEDPDGRRVVLRYVDS